MLFLQLGREKSDTHLGARVVLRDLRHVGPKLCTGSAEIVNRQSSDLLHVGQYSNDGIFVQLVGHRRRFP